jgi:hypothetical protein
MGEHARNEEIREGMDAMKNMKRSDYKCLKSNPESALHPVQDATDIWRKGGWN